MKNHKIFFSQFNKNHLDSTSSLINRAYQFASYAHRNQKRKSGDNYMSHPMSVMNYLRSMDADESVLISALLHDVIEDTTIQINDIEELFTNEIAYIVYFLSKDPIEFFKDRDHRRIVYYRKLEAGFCFNYKIYLIKLVDKLHNLTTSSAFENDKQDEMIKETLNVFIPLFKKYLNVVPKKHLKQCEKIIQDMEQVVKEHFLLKE